LSALRLAVVSLVDGREFPVIQDPEFRLAGVVQYKIIINHHHHSEIWT